MTMIRIISALLLSFSTACVLAQATPPLQLADDAPERHIVVPGDTLWDISAKFLKEPYRWPEIWRMNKEQVKNPHRIYPGQVVILDRSGTDPQLRLGQLVKVDPKVYVDKTVAEIPSIPQNIIEPFLSQPLIVEEDGLKNAPKIVATQEDRVYVGPGNRVYVAGIKDETKLWQIYRTSKPIKDPETQEIIGHEAFFLGTAQQIAQGETATVEIISAKQEIGQGDRLTPASRPEIISYAPHSPGKLIQGQIAAMYGGVKEAGRNSIVTLNRGKRDGLEVGHVLALYRKGEERTYREGSVKETHKLPNERYGLVFVFRTFERISYALVMNVTRPVTVADIVRTP
jgi:hypothetical protein